MLDVVGKRRWTATHIRRETGIDMSAGDLWKLREGDLTWISDNRLLLLGEALGIRLTIGFAEPSNVH